jgi:hypothetical protein
MWDLRTGGITMREDRNIEKNWPSATLTTTNPTCTALELKPGRGGNTRRLRYGTIFKKIRCPLSKFWHLYLDFRRISSLAELENLASNMSQHTDYHVCFGVFFSRSSQMQFALRGFLPHPFYLQFHNNQSSPRFIKWCDCDKQVNNSRIRQWLI